MAATVAGATAAGVIRPTVTGWGYPGYGYYGGYGYPAYGYGDSYGYSDPSYGYGYSYPSYDSGYAGDGYQNYGGYTYAQPGYGYGGYNQPGYGYGGYTSAQPGYGNGAYAYGNQPYGNDRVRGPADGRYGEQQPSGQQQMGYRGTEGQTVPQGAQNGVNVQGQAGAMAATQACPICAVGRRSRQPRTVTQRTGRVARLGNANRIAESSNTSRLKGMGPSPYRSCNEQRPAVGPQVAVTLQIQQLFECSLVSQSAQVWRSEFPTERVPQNTSRKSQPGDSSANRGQRQRRVATAFGLAAIGRFLDEGLAMVPEFLKIAMLPRRPRRWARMVFLVWAIVAGLASSGCEGPANEGHQNRDAENQGPGHRPQKPWL